jgi:hypothetical protein
LKTASKKNTIAMMAIKQKIPAQHLVQLVHEIRSKGSCVSSRPNPAGRLRLETRLICVSKSFSRRWCLSCLVLCDGPIRVPGGSPCVRISLFLEETP